MPNPKDHSKTLMVALASDNAQGYREEVVLTNADGSAQANVDLPALVTLLAAAAGGNSGDKLNQHCRGIKLAIDITALGGTSPTLTVTIQGKDPASGKYYPILASTALAAVATTVLDVYPGIATAANASQGVALPRTFRVLYAIAGTSPQVTATIGASLIL